jgi:hypothetical protein
MKKLFTIGFLLICLAGYSQIPAKTQNTMRVAVWDTYVTKKDGAIMHFDIIAPETVKDTAIIHGYGREYLKSKGQEGQTLTAKECRLCHVRALHPAWEADIRNKGYYILELENCN